LPFESIGLELIREISRLEPFGEGNPAPVFTLRNADLAEHALIGAQKNHLRLRLAGGGKWVGAVGWGMSALAAKLKKGEKVDVAFQLEVNTWENRNLPQLLLSDLRKSEAALERPNQDSTEEVTA